LIIVGIVALTRWLVDQSKGVRGKTALELLQERYARREIGRHEHEQKNPRDGGQRVSRRAFARWRVPSHFCDFTLIGEFAVA